MGTGAGGGHFNRDVGAFQIWRGGRWLSRQTVGYDNNLVGYAGAVVDAQDGAGHNTIFIDGHGISSEYPAATNGPPIVRRLETQPSYTYADVDLTPAYRCDASRLPRDVHLENDQPAVVHVEREYVFVRSLETLVILDRLETDTPSRTKTFLLHSETAPQIEDAQHVTLTVGDQALRLTTLVPATPTYRVVNELPCTEYDGRPCTVGQQRLEVEGATGAAQSYILSVLQARGASDANLQPTVTTTADSYTVRLSDSVSVVFQLGMTSSGGSIVIDGTATPFRADVEPITVSDSGPFWGP